MMFPLQTKAEVGTPGGGSWWGRCGGASWWEVWGSIPGPGTHSTSWFSQKLCFSDRTTMCPVGPGARGQRACRKGDGGLGVWGWSQGGRRLESWGGVGVGIGLGRGGNQGRRGRVQVAECGRARRGEPALQLLVGQVSGPGEASAGFRRRQERGSQSPRAAVPRPLRVPQWALCARVISVGRQGPHMGSPP